MTINEVRRRARAGTRAVGRCPVGARGGKRTTRTETTEHTEHRKTKTKRTKNRVNRFARRSIAFSVSSVCSVVFLLSGSIMTVTARSDSRSRQDRPLWTRPAVDAAQDEQTTSTARPSRRGADRIQSRRTLRVSRIPTESVDRTGEIVVASGMNDGQFQSNPLVTLGHAYWMPPVGRSLWRRARHATASWWVSRRRRSTRRGRTRGRPATSGRRTRCWRWCKPEGSGEEHGFLPTNVHVPERKGGGRARWTDRV